MAGQLLDLDCGSLLSLCPQQPATEGLEYQIRPIQQQAVGRKAVAGYRSPKQGSTGTQDSRCRNRHLHQEQDSESVAVHLGPRRKRPHCVVLYFAFPDLVAAESEQCVSVLASKTDTDHAAAVGDRENDLCGAIIGSDLNATASGNELPAFDGVAHRLGSGVVIPVGDVQVKEAFLVGERAVVIDLLAVNPF